MGTGWLGRNSKDLIWTLLPSLSSHTMETSSKCNKAWLTTPWNLTSSLSSGWGNDTLDPHWEAAQQRSSHAPLSSWSTCLKATGNKRGWYHLGVTALKKYLPEAEMESHLSMVLLLYGLTGRTRIRTWLGASLRETLFLSAFFRYRLTETANCWSLFFFLGNLHLAFSGFVNRAEPNHIVVLRAKKDGR